MNARSLRKFVLAFVCAAHFALAAQEPPPAPVDFDTHIKSGRQLFTQKKYAEALVEFRAAAELKPEHRLARLLAGLAAYWNRDPKSALAYWDTLLASVAKPSAEEWELTKDRVMALTELGQQEPANAAIARLHELRSAARLPEALAAKGFTREHFYTGNLRVGAWELFDEKGEIARAWEFPVADLKAKTEEPVKTYALELVPLDNGKPGYALFELAGENRKTLKRWPAKPPYAEVRELVLAALESRLPPEIAPPTPPEQITPIGPAKPKRQLTESEITRMQKGVKPEYSKDTSRLLQTVAHLAEVDFDLTKFTVLSVTDPAQAKAYHDEFSKRAPFADDDSSNLVKFYAQAGPKDIEVFYTGLPAILEGSKSELARFAILTAINTRGGAFPDEFLSDCLSSPDFMVRQTGAQLLGRAGNRKGLPALFRELHKADPPRTQLLAIALDDLLGPVLGDKPGEAAEDSAAWRKNAQSWWAKNASKLRFNKDGDPLWQVND